MTVGVRGKLFTVSLVVATCVVLAGGAYLESSLRGWLEGRMAADLMRQARLARELLELTATATAESVDPVADRLAASTGARVTVMTADGILGDSTRSAQELMSASNRVDGRGPDSSGYSRFVDTDALHVLLPLKLKETRATVKLSIPLSEVEGAIGRLRMLLLLAGLITVAVAVLMGALASELASRKVRHLVENARAVVAGKRLRLNVPTSDELGGLAGSFNRLAEQFESTVSDLAGERDYLETILEGMSEGVLALDSNRKIARVNRAALRMLGLSGSPTGRELLETVRVVALADLVSKPLDTEATVEFELGPGARRFLARAAPLRSTGGVVIVLHDVTEMRRLETVRRDFVANVSHELRTPVSVIRANSETLLDGALGDKVRAATFLEAILRNSERLSRIIADLLDLSRIEAGEYRVDTQTTELAPIVAKVVDCLQEPARAKHQELGVDVPSALCVQADGRAVDQVLVNLVDNAIKYTPPSGHISVRAHRAGDSVRVEVMDDGPGIEPRHRDRVFERFYRINPGRSRDLGGTGLGLSIVRHLVGAMGGQVGVTSSPQGSVFWFTLLASDGARE